MPSALVFASAAIAAFCCNALLTPLIIRLSHKFKWYDIPDKRKIHKGLIPRLGGVGIFLSVVFISLIFSGVFGSAIENKGFFQIRYLALLAGMTIVHLIGLVDDFRSVRALPKLLIQTFAAATVAAGGFLIDTIPIPYIGTLHLGLLAYPVTVVWIVAILNALNLVDGLDGLASGIAGFAALSMGIIALLQGNPTAALLAFVLFGSVSGFLTYNFPPAKIFMGDSGSYFIGFSLAVIPLLGISKAASLGTLIIPVTLLTIPIIDTLAAIIRRLRRGRSIAAPDKDHIHHKLLDLGLGERKILFFVYGFCLYLSIVSVSSVALPQQANVYLILVVWAGSLLGYYFLDIFKEKKKASSAENRDQDRSSVS